MKTKQLLLALACLLCLKTTFLAQSVVINEIITDPQTDWSTNAFDGTDGNGTISTIDEAIELYIKTDGLDLTGWTIELLDGTDVLGDLTENNTGAFDVANYISSTSGTFTSTKVGDFLVLGNVYSSGAINNNCTINLKNASGILIDSVTLGGGSGEAPSGNATTITNESVQRIPNGVNTNNNTTDFKQNSASLGLPNKPITRWLGTIDSQWNNSGNWDAGTPTLNTNAIIQNLSNLPEISTTANTSDLVIESNAYLTILSNGNLTINGNLSLNTGTDITCLSTISNANSLQAATVILKGTYTALDTAGQFFYFTETNKDNTDKWSLLSSPVIGEGIEKFSDFVGLRNNGSNIAIAPYDNNGRNWDYYKSTSSGDTAETLLTAAGNFTTGKGYIISPNSSAGSISPTAKGNIGFQGDFPSESYTKSITVGSSTSFNLLGNPYPSYIPINDAADGINNLLRINGANGLNLLSEDTIWIWDKETNSYITLNLGSASRFIAPAQGFFVSAKAGGGNFSYTESMQSHQTNGFFTKNSEKDHYIKLSINSNNNHKKTQIVYSDNKTTAFDNGYDSSIFNGLPNTFAIYTQLIDDQHKKLSIQTLPNTDYESMVIPIGITADKSTTIDINIADLKMPEGMNVILEDRLTGIYTDLTNLNNKYTFTSNNPINGGGRFYLHTKKGTLNIVSHNAQQLTINKVNNLLKIEGLSSSSTAVKLYNLLGKELLDHTFKTDNGIQEITLPKLYSGIYIIQIENKDEKVIKKMIFK